MYDMQWLVGTGVIAGVLGILIGLGIARMGGRTRRAQELEAELEASQEELKSYKAEVFSQFGETARKFERLNESYADLHKQLATSASVLCADMDSSALLAGPDSGTNKETTLDATATPSTDSDPDLDTNNAPADEVTADEATADAAAQEAAGDPSEGNASTQSQDGQPTASEAKQNP